MINQRRRTSHVALLLGMLCVLPAYGEDALTLQVSPQVCVEGEDVQITVRVAPDPGNRALTIEADSSGFFRSSRIQLSGDRAPSLHTLRFHSMPSGSYQVRAIVTRQGGVTRSAPVELRVLAGSPEPSVRF